MVRLVLLVVVSLAITRIGFDQAIASDSAAKDTPVDLAHPGPDTCPKDQVSSERGCVTPPRTVKGVPPRYPDRARRSKKNARVELSVVIQVDGKVGKAEVVSCTQAGEGFEDAAVDAVKQWKYEPAKLGGVPIAVIMTTVVSFVAP